MRLTALADACRAAGLTVVEHAGWEHRGGELGRVGAVLAHHTASSPAMTDEAVCRLLINGRPDLPGPLCQVGLDRTGRVHIIASGLANHAGAGSWQGVSGNSHAVGVEAFNDGVSEPWPLVQLAAWDRLNAVLLRLCGLDPGALCAHREWAPTRKRDPWGLDMAQMRSRAAALLTAPEDDDMTPDQAQQLKVATDQTGEAINLLHDVLDRVGAVQWLLDPRRQRELAVDAVKAAGLPAGVDADAIADAVAKGLADRLAAGTTKG